MASTSQKRDWWHLHRCTYGVRTPGGFFGRTPVWAANDDVAEAWEALEAAHLGAGYLPTKGGYIGSRRNCPNGIGGRTCQENGDDCSLHNYCLALDVEYNYNPHFRRALDKAGLWAKYHNGETKYNPDIVDKIYEVKTLSGDRAFRWLGYVIGDTMHWEIDVPPEKLAIDWNTVPGWSDMADQKTSNPAFQPAFDKALASGMFSEYTNVHDVTTAEKLAVYLDRVGFFEALDDGVPPHTHPFSGETG